MSFIKELKRRNVIRVAIAYAIVGWLLVEVASVVLPTLLLPDWTLRILVLFVILGFPLALVFAWAYELTPEGLKKEKEVDRSKSVTHQTGRKLDFIIIGTLAVALSLSLYLNFQPAPTGPVSRKPVSILIADIDNQTKDPIFDGVLEQVLNIGIEEDRFVSSYDRADALTIADKIKPYTELNEEAARLVAIREDVNVILAGSIEREGKTGYSIRVVALDPVTRNVIVEAKQEANSKLEVLNATALIAAEIRRALGDPEVNTAKSGFGETFTAASLEAMRNYVIAQSLSVDGKDEKAIEFYKRAVDEDPQFVRALTGWALSAHELGWKDEADQLWFRILPELDRITEREKYRTLGIYYATVTRNYEKAVETYATLIDLYPADNVARNNLAVSYFYTLDFENARRIGQQIVENYPTDTLYRTNYALYAMYSGDFEVGAYEAKIALQQDRERHKAYLPIAMARFVQLDFDAARDAYRRMADIGSRAESLAKIGEADMMMFQGRYAEAEATLLDGISIDEAENNRRALLIKRAALADTYIAQKKRDAALDVLKTLAAAGSSEVHLVPVAASYIQLGQIDEAAAIAAQLSQMLQPQSRAYGLIIEGMIADQREEFPVALDHFRNGLSLADLWYVRLNMGITYFHAGRYVEALSEFEACEKRRGEAVAMFLDDVPSVRYLAPLPYWLGRANQELGITDVAAENYRLFLSNQSNRDFDDEYVIDARQQLTTL